MTVRDMETEAKLFWTMARQHAALTIAFGPGHLLSLSVLDDVEAIALHSEWPTLRARAQALLDAGSQRRAVS